MGLYSNRIEPVYYSMHCMQTEKKVNSKHPSRTTRQCIAFPYCKIKQLKHRSRCHRYLSNRHLNNHQYCSISWLPSADYWKLNINFLSTAQPLAPKRVQEQQCEEQQVNNVNQSVHTTNMARSQAERQTRMRNRL